ncbi:hypothetical protein, partial [Enterobacter asburiae]
LLPGFSPELQGVYSEKDADGIKRLYGKIGHPRRMYKRSAV